MFERFTDRARKVMAFANNEGQRFNNEYIGTEHIILGLVKEGSGVGANVLKNLDIDLRKVRLEVEKLVVAGPEIVTMGKLPQTPRAKKVIEYAIEESRNLNHNYVGTEHLLLGFFREHDGIAGQVLMNLGLKLEEVREEVLNILGAGATDESHPLADQVSLPRPSVYVPSSSRAKQENTIGATGIEHLLRSLPDDIDYIQSLANELSIYCDRREARTDITAVGMDRALSEDDLARIITQPCTVLRLSPHEEGSLSAAGIVRIADLVRLDVGGLKNVAGIGEASAADIRNRLRDAGLDVGMSKERLDRIEAASQSVILRQPLRRIGILPSLCDRLLQFGIRTVKSLVRQSRSVLTSHGCSPVEVDSIETALKQHGVQLGMNPKAELTDAIDDVDAELERHSLEMDELVKAADYERASEVREKKEQLRRQKEQLQRELREKLSAAAPPEAALPWPESEGASTDQTSTRLVELAGFSRLRFLSFQMERAISKRNVREAHRFAVEIGRNLDVLLRAEMDSIIQNLEKRVETIEEIAEPEPIEQIRAEMRAIKAAGNADVEETSRRIDTVSATVRALVKRGSTMILKCGVMTRGLRDVIEIQNNWTIQSLEDELKKRRAMDINDFIHEKYKRRIPMAQVRLCFFTTGWPDQAPTSPLARELKLAEIPDRETDGLYWYPEPE